jgi:glycine oxidase
MLPNEVWWPYATRPGEVSARRGAARADLSFSRARRESAIPVTARSMTRADRAAPNPDGRADVVVLGGGIVGLAVAAALADKALSVALVAVERPGAAARAAAGLLVPHYSAEDSSRAVAQFMAAGRDLYPSYIRWVEERSAMPVPFDASGAIELARSATEATALARQAPPDAPRLSAEEVARLEPALAPTAGGVFYPRDGAVDNVRLTEALASIVSRHRLVRVVHDAAVRLDLRSDSVAAVCESGDRLEGERLVLAAGAWSARVEGLPRPIPIRPVRGQICAVRGTPLRHVVLGQEIYMVSRGGDRTLVGSTMEDVGFDARTTPAAIEWLRRTAGLACPALADAPLLDAWSGLRPGTPDLLPILGPDPEYPALIYACGHSRNGILLAPITAAAMAAMIRGDAPAWDLSPFSVARFVEAPSEANP